MFWVLEKLQQTSLPYSGHTRFDICCLVILANGYLNFLNILNYELLQSNLTKTAIKVIRLVS